MSRVHPPRRLASACLAPCGSLIRDLNIRDLNRKHGDYGLIIRFPDGSGWHASGDVMGMGPCNESDGHGWDWSTHVVVGECEVLEEALTHNECIALLIMPPDVLEARYMFEPPSLKPQPWVIGVGVFVTHASANGVPRVLYSQRRAGASDGVGAWSCPGGRLDAIDVDIVACARRETLEETGLELANPRVLPGHKLGRRPDGVPYLTVFVHATVRGKHTGWPVAREMEPEKHHPWRWLTDSDLAELEGDVWDRDLARAVLRNCELAETAHREAALASAREALADLRAAYVGKVAPL